MGSVALFNKFSSEVCPSTARRAISLEDVYLGSNGNGKINNEDNVETVQGLYRSFADGDIDAVAET